MLINIYFSRFDARFILLKYNPDPKQKQEIHETFTVYGARIVLHAKHLKPNHANTSRNLVKKQKTTPTHSRILQSRNQI
jgi:hypothetical protein